MAVTKDLLSGAIFALVGLIVVIEAQNHAMGSLLRMGPGYYPTFVGVLAMLIGAALIAKSVMQGGPAVPRIAFRETAILTASIIVFAVSLERLGLVISTYLLIGIGSLAVRPYRPLETLLLSTALVIVGAAVFWWFLQLPIPLWP